jgi:NAD(P)-dependent dehydrogenase (short-subunit alcohol dehydrogenase family)
MELNGKIFVVTGAARGIGLALCEALLAKGARVAMADVDEAALATARAQMSGEGGDAATFLCDVASAAAVHDLGLEVAATFGAIDGWINNAGLARHRWIPDYTEAEIDAMLDVNLKGTILGCQEALRRMIPARRGHIVNIISTASLRGIPSETVYCAAKWGVRGFTQGLQEEAAPHGIRVTAVLPGGVDTAFWDGASERPAPREKFLSPAQVADAVVRVLEMDDTCVVRELELRSLADSDFAVQP